VLALVPVLFEIRILRRMTVADPPADKTFVVVFDTASVTRLALVSILKVLAISAQSNNKCKVVG
jgi:hypothetical protein